MSGFAAIFMGGLCIMGVGLVFLAGLAHGEDERGWAAVSLICGLWLLGFCGWAFSRAGVL